MRLWRKKTHRKTNKNGNRFIWIRSNGDRIEEPNISGLSIEFHGYNNIITIHGDQTAFLNCSIICHGDNSTIDIGEFTLNTSDGVCIANLVIYTNKGANVKIGKDFSTVSSELIKLKKAKIAYEEARPADRKGQNKGLFSSWRFWVSALLCLFAF